MAVRSKVEDHLILCLRDVDAILISGLEAAIASAETHHQPGGVPRQPWFLQVLVEQLLAALPTASRGASALEPLRDPQRGVTAKTVREAADRLLRAGLIAPHGQGRDATWTIPPSAREAAIHAWPVATSNERAAILTAVQRTLATSEAWSKTRAVSGDANAATSTSG